MRPSLAAARTPRGFSLVELMISMVIGLIVVAGVISIFLSSKQAFRTQDGLSQVQESGRFIGYLMSPYIRQAGYLPEPLLQTDPSDHFRGNWQPIFGSDDSFFPVSRFTGVVGVKPGTDAIMVSYAGNANPLGTCRGGQIDDTQIVTNVFYVSEADATGLSALSCGTAVHTSGSGASLRSAESGAIAITNPQPLIQGVQNMQILYGEDTNSADDGSLVPGQSGLFPNRYVDADQVTDWSRIVSLRISVTVDAAERTEGSLSVGTSTSGDTQDDLVEGGRIRRTFTTTLNIRNRLRA
ncbi:MAG: PilW family protein [Panacagrimonas sp.]